MDEMLNITVYRFLNSLNFVNYMKEGRPCGYGVGFILFDGEKVITQKD